MKMSLPGFRIITCALLAGWISVDAVAETAPGDGKPADAANVAGLDEKEVFPTDAQVFDYFSAILRNDLAGAGRWLALGIEVDVPLPPDPPKEFLALIAESRMLYYATRDKGVTALMMAAGTGSGPAVDFLLEHGADRFKKTTRNRTHPLWLASKTGDVDLMRKLMTLDPEGEWKKHTVKVSLSEQKMHLFKEGVQILESPVSSGRKKYPTPAGRFVVTDKHRHWKSTIYHVSMPHFIRLSCGEIGLHAGNLPGYPASHGCIRLPAKEARELFNAIPVGTLVEIEE